VLGVLRSQVPWPSSDSGSAPLWSIAGPASPRACHRSKLDRRRHPPVARGRGIALLQDFARPSPIEKLFKNSTGCQNPKPPTCETPRLHGLSPRFICAGRSGECRCGACLAELFRLSSVLLLDCIGNSPNAQGQSNGRAWCCILVISNPVYFDLLDSRLNHGDCPKATVLALCIRIARLSS
jgi:hypothetical protein